MKKYVLSLLLVLCCLLPLTASAATSPRLPDLTAFAGNLLSNSKTEDFGFCKRVTLYGSKANVEKVALAYIELLTSQYSITHNVHFTSSYSNGQKTIRYALGYNGPTKMGTVGYDDENGEWEIDAPLVLYYTQHKSNNYIQFTYRGEFYCKDHGERVEGGTQPTTKITAKPTVVPKVTPKVTVKPTTGTKVTPRITAKPTTAPVRTCSSCGGDGRVSRSCSSCGGDGDIERRCANCGGDGERDCISCSGKGYNNCSGCNGSGDRRCGSCYGTGKNGSKRCTTCSGRGERRCSSCSGTGRKRCTGCSGSGDRRCTNCGGDGEQESRCSSCGGDGRRDVSCTTCGGDGRIN